MNYADRQLQTLLAAEYVLGTLRGGARRRFEQLRESMPALRHEQAYWEMRLTALGLKLPPRIPPAELWARIDVLTRVRPERTTARPASLLDRVGFWQSVALAASIYALVMVGVLRQAPIPPAADYVSVVQADKGDSRWAVVADLQRGELRYKATGADYPVADDKDLELWLLVKDEAVPISLGLLPKSGEARVQLSADLAAKLARAAGLAVSLEPSGGSQTGAPTGPVLFQAPLLPS